MKTKRIVITFCLSFGFFLSLLPASAQSTNAQAVLVIVDSRDPNLWDYRVRFFDENGKEVATMKRCEIVRLSMTPGPHRFRSNKGKKPFIAISAVADETYYSRAGLRNPLSQLMWFDFEIVTRQEAESWVRKCNLPASALNETFKSEQHR